MPRIFKKAFHVVIKELRRFKELRDKHRFVEYSTDR